MQRLREVEVEVNPHNASKDVMLLHPLACGNPTDLELTKRFHSHLQQIIPAHFEILDLPSEASSFITHMLRMSELPWNLDRMPHTKTSTEFGVDGNPSATKQASMEITALFGRGFRQTIFGTCVMASGVAAASETCHDWVKCDSFQHVAVAATFHPVKIDRGCWDDAK